MRAKPVNPLQQERGFGFWLQQIHLLLTWALTYLVGAGMYKAADFATAVDMADKLVMFGGPGHTSALYTNPYNKDRITAFGLKLKTVRLLINTPSLHGAMGDQFNALDPSLTMVRHGAPPPISPVACYHTAIINLAKANTGR